MIKTLRITSVLAVIAAAVLIKYFVFPVVVGAGGDENIDKVLKAPTVVEKFRETKGDHAKAPDKTSPLVQQALAFADYLNPRPVVTPRKPGDPKLPPKPIIGPTSPKFKVFATTYFEGNPELSQALIDEPGRERRWVRQSSMVGHLLIEQVKDGVVVVKSSNDTYELAVESNPKAAPAKNASPVSKATTGQSPVSPTSATYSRAASGISRTHSRPPAQLNTSTSPEREKAANELVQRLSVLQKSSTPEDKARIGQLIATFKPTIISSEDAQNLTKLGEKVENGDEDPNRASSSIRGGKIETGPSEPDDQQDK